MTRSNMIKKATVGKRNKVPVETISAFDQKVAISYLTQIVVAQLSSALIEVNKEKGWRKADIARRLGVDEAQVSRWFNGRQPNMTLETIAILAAAMDREPEFVLRALEQHDHHQDHVYETVELTEILDWELESSETTSGFALVADRDVAHA